MLVAPQFSHVQRREVTTYLVTAPGGPGGYHCSIQQAIDKAEPYSRIVIASGQYFESLTVTTPIELIGEEGDSPEITGRGTCLSVAGDVECYFENMRIIFKGSAYAGVSSAHAPRGSGASVRLISGRPTFRNCEMASMFVGGSASPVVTNCNILGSPGGCGLVVAEDAGGVFRKNVIANHVPWCISCSSRGSPVFEENDIYQDLKAIVHQNSAMRFVTGGTILITRDGSDTDRSITPRFTGNRIRDDYIGSGNMSTSRTFAEMAKAVVYDSEFDKVIFSERATVRVDSTCSPYFEDNHILGGCVGLHFAVGGGGNFVSNVVVAASMYGVVLETYSNPVLRVNTISRCKTGVFAEATCANLVRNTIRESEGAGMVLLVTDEDRFKLDQNTFVGNDTGIAVRPGSKSAPKNGPGSNDRLIYIVQKEMEEQRAHEALVAAEEAAKVAEANYDPYADESLGGSNTGTKQQDSDQSKVSSTVIQKNIVTHNKSCGITVYGSGCSATLRDLFVVNNGKFGALCAFGATPIFDGVTFEDGDVGFVSEKSAHPKIVRCVFVGQRKACVSIRERGRATIDGNNFHGFAGAGVVVRDAGNPLIMKNTFAECRGTGIVVSAGGIGTITENKFDTISVGIEVSAYGDPVVHNNKFHQCVEMGAYIHEEGLGTFTENEMSACTVGFGATTGAECVVRNNVVTDAIRTGFIGGDEAHATVEKNEFAKSVGGNILLEGNNCDCTVRRNRVHKAIGFGIRSLRNAVGIVTRNHISENGEGGLSCMAGGQTVFRDNIVRLEKGPGIVVTEGGRGHFVDNNVESGISCGLELGEGSDALIEGCLFIDNDLAGVHVLNGAGSLVRKCTVTKNRGGISFVGFNCRSTVRFESITIEDNHLFGIQLLEQGSGSLHDCIVRGQEVGLVLETAGEAIFERCEVTKNKIGAELKQHGVATLSNCLFCNNEKTDVLFSPSGSGFVKDCKFIGGSPYGVLCRDGAHGDVTGCSITGCEKAGILIKAHARTLFESNTVFENYEGLVCEANSLSKFFKNTFTRNTRGNAKLLQNSGPILEENVFEYSPQCGLYVDQSNATVRNNTIQHNAGHGIEFACSSKAPTAMVDNAPTDPTRRKAVQKARALVRVAGAGAGTSSSLSASTSGGEGNEGPTLQCTGNTIFSNQGSGLFFHPFTRSLLKDNVVSQNQKSGAIVKIGANPVLDSNKFHDNLFAGLIIDDRGSPDVKNNQFFQNTPCNIELKQGSLGILSSNEISSGRPDGIVAVGSTTTIRKNRIVRNADGNGITLDGPNEFLPIENNEITNNGIGILCTNQQSSAQITENHIASNTICGVRLCANSCPAILQNVFESGSVGLHVLAGARGRVVENQFLSNQEGLVLEGEPIHSTCLSNWFFSNQNGVCVRGNKSYSFHSNSFGANEEGILVEEGATPILTKNDFKSTKRGVLVRGTAGPAIHGNTFIECGRGVELMQQCSAVVSKNCFTHCGFGLTISSNDSAIFVYSNLFAQCSTAGLCTEGDAVPSMIVRNVFTGCDELETSCGILLRNGGGGKFLENDIHCNSVGVLCEKAGQGEVARSLLHDNKHAGILATDAATQSTFVNCAIVAKGESHCVKSTTHSRPKIVQCLLRAEKVCTLLTDSGCAEFQGCFVRGGLVGFLFEGAGTANITHTIVTGCTTGVSLKRRPSTTSFFGQSCIVGCGYGVVTSSNGGACLVGNVITQCEVGVLVEKRGSGQFAHNTIAKHTKTGIHIRGVGTAVFANNIITDCNNVGINVHVPLLQLAQSQQQQVVENSSFTGSVENSSISPPPNKGLRLQLPNIQGNARSPLVPSPTSPTNTGAASGSWSISEDRHPSIGRGSEDTPDDDYEIPRITTDVFGSSGNETPDGFSPANKELQVMTAPKRLESKRPELSVLSKGDTTLFGSEEGEQHGHAGEEPLSPFSAAAEAAVHQQHHNTTGDTWFIENRVSHSRTLLQVASGACTFSRNHFHNGDWGITAQSDTKSTFDANVVYDNMRVGMLLNSRDCTLTRNEFYSPNEFGAFESDFGQAGLARDNQVFNHCHAKMPVPLSNAPAKQSNVVDPRSPTKDLLLALTEALRAVHTSELPAMSEVLPYCGCPAIEGSNERAAVQTMVVFHGDGSYSYGVPIPEGEETSSGIFTPGSLKSSLGVSGLVGSSSADFIPATTLPMPSSLTQQQHVTPPRSGRKRASTKTGENAATLEPRAPTSRRKSSVGVVLVGDAAAAREKRQSMATGAKVRETLTAKKSTANLLPETKRPAKPVGPKENASKARRLSKQPK